MRRPLRRSRLRLPVAPRRVAAWTLVLLGALAAAPRTTAAPLPGPRFGLFTMGGGPTVEAASAGLREGLRLSGLAPEVLERSVESDEATARAALNEFALEGVDVVFVLGPDAACLARDTLRGPSVVFSAVGYPDALGLPGRGNVCGVAGGIEAGVFVDWARRNAPSLRTLGIVAAADAESRAHTVALEAAARERGVTVARAAPDKVATLLPACDAVLLPPGVNDRDAEAVARTLRGKGVPLLGSRRGHLTAGCSAVLRTAPRAQGMRAAGLGRRVLRGDAPGEIGTVHLVRRLSEVSLEAARRLGHDVPVPVVATADHLVPAIGRRR